MATDVVSGFAGWIADLGIDVADALGDLTSRNALLARAGIPAPDDIPSPNAAAKDQLQKVKDKASQRVDETDPFETLNDLATGMATLYALVQQMLGIEDADDAWNVLATCLDIVALDRFREKNPETLALLYAFHLVSDNRLQLANLVRAHDSWGDFLLGAPTSDDETANNWSLILGAIMVVLGKLLQREDAQGKAWRTDLLFGWDAQPDSPHKNADSVLRRMATVRLTHDDDANTVSEQAGMSIVVVPPNHGGWGVYFALNFGAALTFPIGDHLELETSATSSGAIEAFIGPDEFVNGGLGTTAARIELRRKKETSASWQLGATHNTHLEIETFRTGIEFSEPLGFRFHLGNAALIVPQGEFGFLGANLPAEGARFTFDIDALIDSKGRLSFAGGAGLRVTIPVNASISVLNIRGVTVALTLGERDEDARSEAVLSVTAAFALVFGHVFKVVVDGLGAKYAWVLPAETEDSGTNDNLGPAGHLGVTILPPKGIGVTIDASRIKGGGFLYLDAPEAGLRTYAGVLEVELSLVRGMQIKAAGLLRETASGWNFAAILSLQFDPGIDLFAGLTLNGIGGIVGINTGVDLDRLRAGLHDGAVGRLLFPADPIGNAPNILATMAAVFPERQGFIVAGPAFQLGWGRPASFVTLSAAIVLTLPEPAQILILGRLHIFISKPKSGIIDIKVDFLGQIDLEEPWVAIDAALVDSRVGGYAVTGDMALRANGNGFVLAVGGFHPDFDAPVNMPKMRRVRLDISPDKNARIQVEGYLAVTSNTFQLGMHAALDIDAGPATLHGWLNFDTLVRWEPRFHFSIQVSVGLELRVGGRSWAGVSADLLLDGPGPWHAKGSASISFFFFSIHAGFEHTWGEVAAGSTPSEVNAAELVAQALRLPGAWTATLPDDSTGVTLRTVIRDAVTVLPQSRLSARQQAVPIGVPIVRVGQSRVVGGKTAVKLVPSGDGIASAPTTGKFAAAQFIDFTDDQLLTRPSFEPFQDGISVGSTSMSVAPPIPDRAARYETVFIPDNRKYSGSFNRAFLKHALMYGAIARSGLHATRLNDTDEPLVTVNGPAFKVVAADSLIAPGDFEETFSSASEAFAAAGASPDDLVIVGVHEAGR
jgi:hypothetical protein